MTRVLIISNSTHTRFGYAVVFAEVADALRDAGYEVYYFGIQSIGPSYKSDGITYLGIGYDVWGADMLVPYIKALNIDILISGLDLWMPFQEHYAHIKEQCPNIKWLAHLTINSSPLSPYLAHKIFTADTLISPSKFGMKELEVAGFKNTFYIPHGVDLDVYKPERDLELRKVFKIKEEDLLFISVMRNKGSQKNYPALFKSYFAALQANPEMRENTKLMIICDPREPEGFPLLQLREMMGLNNNIKFVWVKLDKESGEPIPTFEGDPEGIPYNSNLAFTSQTMAKIYNMCDVNVQTSSGESFGLPIIESMACGLPQLTFLATTGKELVAEGNAGITIEPAYVEMAPALTDLFLIDMVKLFQGFKEIYLNKDKRIEFSKNGLEHVKNYDIKTVRSMWVELLDSVCASKVESKSQDIYHSENLGI